MDTVMVLLAHIFCLGRRSVIPTPLLLVNVWELRTQVYHSISIVFRTNDLWKICDTSEICAFVVIANLNDAHGGGGHGFWKNHKNQMNDLFVVGQKEKSV